MSTARHVSFAPATVSAGTTPGRRPIRRPILPLSSLAVIDARDTVRLLVPDYGTARSYIRGEARE